MRSLKITQNICAALKKRTTILGSFWPVNFSLICFAVYSFIHLPVVVAMIELEGSFIITEQRVEFECYDALFDRLLENGYLSTHGDFWWMHGHAARICAFACICRMCQRHVHTTGTNCKIP